MTPDFNLPPHFEDVERQGVVDLDVVMGRTNADLLRICTVSEWWQLKQNMIMSYMYYLVKNFRDLSAEERGELVEVLSRGVEEAIDAGEISGLKVAAFFACGLVVIAEEEAVEKTFGIDGAGQGRGRKATQRTGKAGKTWSWDAEGRELVLRSLVRASEEKSIWKLHGVSEDFASFVWRSVLTVVENASAVKNIACMECVCRVVAIAGTRWGQAIAIRAAFVHSICKHEHAGTAIASVLAWIDDKFGDRTFVDEALTEFASSASLASDSTSARGLGSIFSEFAQLKPMAMARTAPLLLFPLLDEEPYLLRNGVIDALTSIAAVSEKKEKSGSKGKDAAFDGEEEEEKGEGMEEDENLRESILEVLLVRTHDAHAFTRSRTMQAWTRLVEAHILTATEFAGVANAAVERLEDKAAAVRRASLQLWCALLSHNPYAPSLSRSSLSINEKLAMQKGNNPNCKLFQLAQSFADTAERGVRRAGELLKSQSVTDVVEAISMVLISRQFKVDGAEEVCRSMLPLILSRDRAVSEATTRAFGAILFETVHDGSAKEQAVALARSLVALMRGTTVGERVCLDKLIEQLITSGGRAETDLLSPVFVQVLWDVVSGKVGGTTPESRCGACGLLAALGSLRRELVLFTSSGGTSRIATLTSLAVQEENAAMAREACTALVRIVPSQTLASEPLLRMEANETAVTIGDRVLRRSAVTGSIPNDLWLPWAEQALHAIYTLADAPERITASAIEEAGRGILAESKGWAIARLVFLIGQTAVKQLVFNETSAREMGRRAVMGQQNSDDGNERESIDAGLHEAVGVSSGGEFELALERGEEELVGQGSLLGKFAPLVARVAADSNMGSVQRAAAATALAKLMAVHCEMCERYVQLMFSLLEARNAPPSVRANTIIALGDLAFRYPNVLEPWSSRLYLSLRDSDVYVRRNTIATLAHLILNDMVKVRGQIVEMVLSLDDEDPRVVQLTRLFFHELSHKSSNLIYNILPDTVSCLSQRKDIDRMAYRTVMKFLVSFLDKGRHAEGMVDKLCPRFRATDNVQDWRDIAFVLSLLPYNDRAVRKLLDGFRSYADKIQDAEVFQSFSTIISKAKHQPKTDRSTATELEDAITRAHNRDKDEDIQDVLRDVINGTKTPSTKTPAKRKSTKVSTVSRDYKPPSDATKTRTRGQRASKTRSNNKNITTKKPIPIYFSDDDNSDK